MATHQHTIPAAVSKLIPEYPAYRVLDDGRVQTCYIRLGVGKGCYLSDQWRDLSLKPDSSTGYPRATLYRDGKKLRKHVHELVLEVFVGPRPEGMVACHENGNPCDNRLSNLSWGTPEKNEADKLRHGRRLFGSRHPNAKLTESDVLEIRRLGAKGRSRKQLAEQFGVTKPMIGYVLNRKWWVHV